MDTSSIEDPVLQKVLHTAQETRSNCLSILDFLDNHRQASAEPAKEDALALSRLQKQLTAHLSLLRGQHRQAVFSVRETKSQTAAAKSEIDSLHLQLQNLFYEQRHLRGEIQGCDDYPHKYTQLALTDVDDFLSRQLELSESSEHELMIARIKDEHEQRKRLDKERLALVKRKAELVKSNQKQKDELDKLDKEVEAWVEASAKVGKIFEERAKKEVATKEVEMSGTG